MDQYFNKKLSVLYLKHPYPDKTGGESVEKRNISIFEENFQNFLTYDLDPITLSGINALTKQTIPKGLRDLIIRQKPKLIVFPNSFYGLLARNIKKEFPNIFLVGFFHNVEFDYIKQDDSVSQLKKIFRLLKIFLSEGVFIDSCDFTITLNERDSKRISKLYKRKTSFILPVFYPLNFNRRENEINEPLKLLFVGSNFYANNHGILWFIENVLPKLEHVKLTIVGRELSKDILQLQSSNIVAKENVQSISEEYWSCDVVIVPIFKGSGMKTKTAEALSHGKPIITTNEGFIGFEDLDLSRVGFRCNTESEFTQQIKLLSQNKELLKELSIETEKTYRQYLYRHTDVKPLITNILTKYHKSNA